MFTHTIDKKPLILDNNGNMLRDLTKSMFNFQGTFINTSVYKVPTGFEMRPDLISQSVYNNTLYAEYVLKFNGISNPFTIAPHDIILIPILGDFEKTVTKESNKGNDEVEERIRNKYKYIDPTKIPKKDKNINNFNQRDLNTNNQNNLDNKNNGSNLDSSKLNVKEGSLPPNINKKSDTGITYRNGRVYFGENVGQSACLKNGMSSSEFLTQIIKKKV